MIDKIEFLYGSTLKSELERNKLLLISNIGYSHGWVPNNIVVLRDDLVRSGYVVDLAFYSVEYSVMLEKKYPKLIDIDRNIGEWETCFHEVYFAGKSFGHEDPLILVEHALELRNNNKDIFCNVLLPRLETMVAREVLGTLPTYPDPVEINDRVVEYCKTAELFLWDKIQQLLDNKYAIIGFSCNNAQFYVSYWMAQTIISLDPSVQIVFGGPLFTEWNKEFFKRCFPNIHCFIVGKGELVLPTIMAKAGIAPCISTEMEEKLDSLRIKPDDSAYSGYTDISVMIEGSATQWTYPTWLGQNCSWHRCSFCADNLLPHRIRCIDEVAHEIEQLINICDARSIGFAEPDVNGSQSQFEALLSVLSKTSHSTSFWCELNARNTSKAMFVLMKRVGFDGFQLGVESFSNKLLRKMNKPATVIDNIKALKWARDVGFSGVLFNLICLFPGEDATDITETHRNMELFPHLLTSPVTIQLAEFELLRPAPVYKEYSRNNQVSDYEFFTMALPENLRQQFPFWRQKTIVNQISSGWVEIAKYIYAIRNRRCSLTWRRKGVQLMIEDFRDLQPKIVILDNLECDILIALNDGIFTAEQLAVNLNHSMNEITDALIELTQRKLLYSERNYYISLVNDAQEAS